MGSLGWQELVIVLIIVIIIFGAGKLPEIGGALGKGIKEFRAQAGDEKPAEPIASSSTSTRSGRREDAPVVETREMRPDEI